MMMNELCVFHDCPSNFSLPEGYDPVFDQSEGCGPKLVLRTEYHEACYW